MMRLVSAKPGEPGALTRIHGGLRNTGVSGRCAFSGWRGRGDCSVSRTMAMKRARLYLRAESPPRKPASPAHCRMNSVSFAADFAIRGAHGVETRSAHVAHGSAIRGTHPRGGVLRAPSLGHRLTVPQNFLNGKFLGKFRFLVEDRPCQLAQSYILGASQIRASQNRALQNNALEV